MRLLSAFYWLFWTINFFFLIRLYCNKKRLRMFSVYRYFFYYVQNNLFIFVLNLFHFPFRIFVLSFNSNFLNLGNIFCYYLFIFQLLKFFFKCKVLKPLIYFYFRRLFVQMLKFIFIWAQKVIILVIKAFYL